MPKTPSDRPGVVQMLGALVRRPFEEQLLREEAARHDRLSYEAANAVLAEVVRRVEPETDGYVPIDGLHKRELDPTTQTSLREAAQRAVLENTHASGYLGSLRRFVIGKGATISVEHDDETVAQACEEWIAAFQYWNNWEKLEDEIPERTWRDGEGFVRRFDLPPVPKVADNVQQLLQRLGTSIDELTPDEEPPEGMIFVRLIPAEQIVDPTGTVSHGIITAADDVQTVLGYCWAPDGKTIKEVIPAAEVLHVKARVDSDVKRGRSVLEPMLKRIRQFEDWLNYRITLNLMRTAVVLVKTVTGSPGQIGALRDAQQKEREDTPGANRGLKMLKPGTTVHASPGVSYEFKNPQINAQDAKEDGRQILLTLAAASGLPEYMHTGDASNANYSSTMVSESPAVREFEAWQDFFTPVYVQLHRWALIAGARANAIKGLSEEQARTVEIKVAWPPLLSRNETEHAAANKTRREAGILSLEGMARDEGIDWDVEKQRLEEEAKNPPKLPIATQLRDIAQATQAGVLTPDENLEKVVRQGLGIPALVAEEPGIADPDHPDEPDRPPMPPLRDPPKDDPPTPESRTRPRLRVTGVKRDGGGQITEALIETEDVDAG